MKKRFCKMTFSEQIRFFYVWIYLIIFILCGALYMISSWKYVSKSENDTLEYGFQIVESNLEALLENVNDYSKVIAFNESVQTALRMEAGETVSYEDKVALQDAVILMSACCDGISSIYLFDQAGENYIAGDVYEVEILRQKMADMSLYQEMLMGQDNGSSGLVLLNYESEMDEKQVLSFVRVVRNLNTMEDIGVLAMNISANKITDTFRSVAEQTGMEVAIFNENGDALAVSQGGEWLENLMEKEGLTAGRDGYKTVSKTGDKYKAGVQEGENGAWYIVGAIPRSQVVSDIRQYMIYSVLILILGMAVCVLGASFITRRITGPLQNILASMELVKAGKLERIAVIETNQEMDSLQQHYNRMLDGTEQLMVQKVEEQRLRRKYELSLLQAQIKPHFLYNTFDSVGALAMMGRNQDVYTMMQALGLYYRNSLNKGKEIITIREELEIVENYLIIQHFRYEDVFEVEYDVDESVNQYTMIKLVLQPLVENAIYHGFREHDLQGTITVRAKDAGDYVKLQVEDDGIGMRQEKLDEILRRSDDNQGKRFGLYGTLQRIKLYYHQEERELVEIESELGEGTVITIWIPKEKEEDVKGFSN